MQQVSPLFPGGIRSESATYHLQFIAWVYKALNQDFCTTTAAVKGYNQLLIIVQF